MKSLTGWILVLAFNSDLFGAVSPTGSPDEIPFRLYRGYMILVEGNIGTLDGLTFVIDTGATSTLLNSGIAKKLRLKGKGASAVAYGRRLDVERVILQEVEVGATRFRSVPVLIADFSLLPVIGNHIDAIIGTNALSRINFAIDYKAG